MATIYLIFMGAMAVLLIAVAVKSIITGKKFEPTSGAFMPRTFGQQTLYPHTTVKDIE